MTRKSVKIDSDRYIKRKEFAVLCGNGKEIPHTTLIKAIKSKRVTEIIRDNTYYIDLEAKNTKAYLQKKQSEAVEKEASLPKTLDTQKKELEIRRVQEDLRLKEIKRKRMEKEVIPTSIIYPVYNEFYAETWRQVHYGVNEWVTSKLKKHQVPKADQAKYKGELVEVLNKIIDKVKQANIESTNKVIANHKEDE